MLTLLQHFSIKEQTITSANEWYKNYTRFLVPLKNRATVWKKKEKYRPSLIIDQLKKLRRIRNKYYRERKRGCPNEETRVLLRVINGEVRREIATHKSILLLNNQTKISSTRKSFLVALVSCILMHFSKLDNRQSVLSDKKEIVHTLFSYYEKQFKKTVIKTDEPNDMGIEEEHGILLKELSVSEETIQFTSAFEITKFIKKLKPKKSSGFEQISNFMMKLLPQSYITCLVNCFNVWLNDGRYPDQCKLTKIGTLNKLKAGVPRCDESRPISLLATHSKLFGKVILEKVRYWAEMNQLIPSEQSAFHPDCVLPRRVLSIYQEVDNNRVGNIPTLVIYMDYQKAYDKVCHAALIVKLNRLGMVHGLLKFVV